VSSVFELGIGTGNVAKAILENNTSASYAGVDISEEMLKAARTKLSQYNCHFIKGDFRETQLPSVDAIASSLSIHHLDPEGQASLLKRVYSASGRFLHFELIAPEDGFEKRQFEEFEQHIISEVAPRYGVSSDAAKTLHEQSKQNDKPMKLSDHARIHERLGVRMDIIFRDHCFVFYEGNSNP
jgi:ubiquinone/menaquinone biosynthesis C-methylase UbiE